jgi:hypothetical protein
MTNVSKLSRLERSFVAETQGPPEIPPRVPAAVVGSINHHDLDAHRYPEPPFGGPTVDGESIGHQEGTAQNKVVFESVQKEVGVRLAPLRIRLLPRLFHHALPRILALGEQRAIKGATNTVRILLRVAQSDRVKRRKGRCQRHR